ncbi:MAG TPA: hypothetical protein VGX68_22560 [Thermoanaerobaculia bacterium]|nr:hypothetical protein [Thermoanaerobaculia bacterium]
MANNSYATFIALWKMLIAAARAHELDLPQIAPFAAALEEAVEDLSLAKARQRSLQEKSLQATREANDRLACSREMVQRLKNFVIAAWGPRDARLADFGIQPLGQPRVRRSVEKGGSPGLTH